MTKRERITLSIDNNLIYQAKVAALDLKIKPRDVVELALQQFLKNHVSSDR